MQRNNLIAVLVIILSVITSGVYAQNDTLNVGSVSGLLKDSLHNYVLESATVSVYNADDGKLIAYQLSNNFGRFVIRKLPVGAKLKLVATSVGYQSAERFFNVPKSQPEHKLETIYVKKADVSLKEVTVHATPPMQMKGDTLEFNADAFTLDTNAVVEDLLRKLPGVTIWRDGVITVNGKKISKLLVGGKDFFGGDASVALQNLPKNSIDKIQIYKNNQDKDPINPPVEMNLILKKENRKGYFGKTGIGYGTDKRYAADGMISAYSPKLQLSVVGAANNVNKIATDVGTLMNFNSFKGEQIDNDFHSDFLKQGENKFRSTGVRSDYEFNKEHRLKADFLYDNVDNTTNVSSESLFTLGDGKQLKQSNIEESSSSNFGRRFNSEFNIKKDNYDIGGRYDVQNHHTNRKFSQFTQSENEDSGQSNTSRTQLDNSNWRSEMGGGLGVHTRRYEVVGTDRKKSVDFDFDYSVRLHDGKEENHRLTNFESTDAGKNVYFNRDYQTKWNSAEHRITTGFKDILGLFNTKPSPVILDISNSLYINRRAEDTGVLDKQDGTGQSIPNLVLSNENRYNFTDERPKLQLSKTYNSSLTNRYQKYLRISVSTEGLFASQENFSDLSYRNIKRDYAYFIPSAMVNFSNNQFGYFEKTYNFYYTTSVQYPTIDELSPIVDDANVYYRNYGNIGLRPAYSHQLIFSYSYNNAAAKHPLIGSFSLRANTTSNFISDSVYYDDQGLMSRYPVNVSDRQSVTAYSGLQKAFKIFNNQVQANLDASLAFSRTPIYINGLRRVAESTDKSASLELKYTYKSIINSTIGQRVFANNTEQGSLNAYKFRNWITNFGLSVALPRSIFFSTKIDFNRNISSVEPVNYTIWNIDLGYRFLKGNNGEIKFSALDLLHQNRSIINSASGNSFMSRRVNVLQQYFMVGLAYYPRKFSFKKK